MMEAVMKNNVTDYPGVDWAQCLELAGQNVSLAQDLLKMFVDTLADEMTILATAYTSQDYVALKNQAHKLHGALCYCAIPSMKVSVLGLEKTCLAFNTDPTFLPEPHESITRHYNELQAEAQALLQFVKE
jgi:HPt (histidine-containing phosphotransfer) domain-containing protein